MLDGSSEATGLTIGGQEVPIEQAAQQLAQQLAPLGDVVDLKFDEQVRTGSSLSINALHLKVLSAAGTPVLEVIAGVAQRRPSAASVCDPTGQTPTGPGGNGANSANGKAATARPTAPAAGRSLANGVRGSTCGKLTMYFTANHKRSLTSRLGQRQVVRGRIVNCAGHSIVRARIDVIHVLKNGKRKLVKTGLRSRDGGKLTLILPLNLKTRDLRFEYRGNLLSTQGHLALDAAHQRAQPPRQAHPLGDSSPSPEGAARAEKLGRRFLFRRSASSSNHTRARPSLRSLPQRSAMRSRIRQPMPRVASGARARARIADLHVQRPARVDQRAQLDAVVRAKLAVLDAVGHELGDDELDLAGARPARAAAPRPRAARGRWTRRAAAADGSPRGLARAACNDGERRTWRLSQRSVA